MDQVQFDEDKIATGQGLSKPVSATAKLFIKMGIIRDPDNAQFVLIGISILCFVVAIVIFLHFVLKIF